MRTCNICKHTKFGFQFFTTAEGYFTFTYDVCNKCADELREKAVRDYQYKLNKKNKS